jgi:hypothetical protein
MEKKIEAQKTVETMTLEELKSLWYDRFKILQMEQNNINILEAEIQKRKNAGSVASPSA